MYISPDAQISSRLEEFCAEYEQTIIISEDVELLMSEKARETLRLIDNIVMNESKVPRKIFTFDIIYQSDNDNLPLPGEGYEIGSYVKHPEFEN
mmetsp:Transcript_14387/g.13998  ORF Transcript_14387/g.13998 Transcript_14387/m.13998 type:complete len:94 (-) Transcript_14387:400-681(-)